MLRTSFLLNVVLVSALALTLGACLNNERDDDPDSVGDRPVPTPEPTETSSIDPTAQPEVTATPEPDPANTPEPGSGDDWYGLITTEKSYPEERTGERVLELAENDAELQELWDWFGLETGNPSEIDGEGQLVLFAGTGESGGCALVLDSVVFNEASGLISVNASRDVPSDTACTADWTPRVFVIAMDRDHLGEGKLLAAINSGEGGGPDPASGTVIREE